MAEGAYGRDIDHRLKQKHVKLHLIEKAKSSQMRPVIYVLKSLFKHLKKLGVIKRDILLTFDNVKQKPPRHERKLDVSTVKKDVQREFKAVCTCYTHDSTTTRIRRPSSYCFVQATSN